MSVAALGACGDKKQPITVDAAVETPDGPPQPACADGIDNDGDGLVDYPVDPGCTVPQVDDESDGCPSGVECPHCSDEIDNDGNGKTDYPDDSSGCSSASDPIEFTDDPNACGAGLVIKPLPLTGIDSGTLVGTISNVASPCGGGSGLPAIAYVFHLTKPRVVVATTDDSATVIDTVLDLRSSMCAAPTSELACHDDLVPSGTGAKKTSRLTKSLPAGTYYLIVGGKTASDIGMYTVNVKFLAGEGSICGTVDDCGDGLVCRVPVSQTQKVCAKPVCSDGADDDGDGISDYPDDPGCADGLDDSEADSCNTSPPGPDCPECGNRTDDNNNGDTDYPDEANCKSAGSTSESCVHAETIGRITGPTTMGTTVGATNDFKPSCGTTSGHTAPDIVYRLDIPGPMATLDLQVTGFSSAQALLSSTCENPSLACTSSSTKIARTNVAPGAYYVVIDGYSTASGTFTLTTSGTIAADQSCEGPLVQAGAFTCAAGYSCKGPAGSRTCTIASCGDGNDNDGDGKSDAADPGCTSTSDDDEADDCSPTVGPNCPQCADGVDNDGDGATDYPADTSCKRPSSEHESCAQSEPLLALTMPQTMGTTVGAVNDGRPACSSSSGAAGDLVYSLALPAMASLTIDNVNSFDAAVALYNSTCGGTALQCSDEPEKLTLSNLAAGTYYYMVDGWSTGTGPFTIAVSGTIQSGESCESPLAQSGAIVCPPQHSCAGPMGMRRCLGNYACNDGMDNDGDGKTDYPLEPGCSSPSDTDESDSCVTMGPDCPQCGNGIDDDMDMKADYPADTRCPNASFFHEQFCTPETFPDLAGPIASPATMGTLVGRAGNYQQSCQPSTGSDTAYGLVLPVVVEKLEIDTIGSAGDTVISLWDAACTAEIECDDDGAGQLKSRIKRNNVAAGVYAIQVDSAAGAANNTTFQLNVKGTVAAGTACTDPLFTSGVLACRNGTTCTAGTCQ